MKYRKLGASGMYVSEIAYGNWMTHGDRSDQETAEACVHAALDLGITTFDTADVYAGTRAEAVLGTALAGTRREGVEIATKVYFPTGPGPNDRGLSRKHILESIDGSLRRLGTDYVDLYQAHRYDYETPLEETMAAFADVVRAGKALYIGVSEWTVDEIQRGVAIARELGIQLVSNQPQYNLLWRVIEAEVAPASVDLGLTQVVWSPLAQGVLTGKYGRHDRAGVSRFIGADGDLDRGHRYMSERVIERIAQVDALVAEAGLTMSQYALAWVLANDNVSSAIVGASRPEQLRANVTAVGVELDPQLVGQVDEILGDLVERDPSKVESFPVRP